MTGQKKRKYYKSLLTAFLLIWLMPTALAQPPLSPQRYRNAIDDPLGQQKTIIYSVYGEFAVRGQKVHSISVRRMIDTGIKRLAGETDLARAWRHFIHEDDVVALKFSRYGEKQFGTNRDVAAGLLHSLYQAGFQPDQFILVGLEDLPEEALNTRPWKYGWQEEQVDFGSDRDHLPVWLNDVTAIINLPLIMSDNISGIRGALVNLTWPLIKRPARLYLNHGDPFIPDIYQLPQIRGKVRLHIANGLRILYYGGPNVTQRYMVDHGRLIFTTDPVALDRIGLELIRNFRRMQSLPQGVDEKITAPFLKTCQDMGLGYQDLNFIDFRQITPEKKDEPTQPQT